MVEAGGRVRVVARHAERRPIEVAVNEGLVVDAVESDVAEGVVLKYPVLWLPRLWGGRKQHIKNSSKRRSK